ncbi:NAD(P)H-binding protein [Actinokineospora auranticolor]|uniref:Uncharacterized protein YbjT (DUF2867 family) n=1 Tax=Actinokineospora auranticolor TaxID=155976 RepID=A0A2S6GJM9_9PSEU|nr:NAD(P)H-binding protein [Actinokineospora auranticolor]PPK65415.1 uncharacterized protein YbjT (DUF2867 family) [Actinokineospora auranticolor]
MRVLVTGATGSVGKHVVDNLVKAGVTVRAVTRNPDNATFPDGVEVVAGDLEQPDSLTDALTDVQRVYVFPGGDTKRFAELARQAGVERIVTLSSASAAYPDDWGGRHHRDVEIAVEESGVPWTHVRPGMFIGNLFEWVEGIRAEGVARAPYGALRLAPVHEGDIGAVAAKVLVEDGHEGRIYQLTGPETLSRAEMAGAVAAGIGRPVRFEELTPDQWRERVSAFIPAPAVDWLLQLAADNLDNPEPVLSTVPDLLGRPARGVTEWATENADAFRA